MIEIFFRGIPYYIVFLLLFIIFRKYNVVLMAKLRIRKYKKSVPFTKDNNKVIRRKEEICEKKRKQLLYSTYIILFLFFGLRGYVYTDFTSYKPFFDLIDGFSSLAEVILFKGWEPGFVVYTAICKMIIPDYFAWNAISTIIDLFLLYKILERYSTNHLLSLLVFFIIGATALEFNVLRNAKAIFIFLYALRYIEERKMWKYFAAIFIACLFHMSSVLFFPLYFILDKKWPKWVLITLCVIGAMIMVLQFGFISNIVSRIPFADESRLQHLASYLDDASSYQSIFGNVERIITIIIVILLYDKLAKMNKGKYMFVNMYVLLYVSFSFCSESAVMVQRFQYMFIASFWIMYPLLIQYSKRKKNLLIYSFIVSLLVMKLVLIAGDPNLEYENVITGVSDFDNKANYVMKNLGK